MNKKRWMMSLSLIVALLFSSVLGGATQVEPLLQENEKGASIEWRLHVMANRLRMAMALATLAVLSPTLADHHLHAQQVVNLLEGTSGKHFVRRVSPEEEIPGLLIEVRALSPVLVKEQIKRVPEPALFAAKNTLSFLNLALEESLKSLRRRRLETAAEDMLRAYAYLSAALGRESDPIYLGGVLALIRLLPPPPEEGVHQP